MNTALAKQILCALRSSGIEEFCLCPGARNAPLVAVLTANPSLFKVLYFFEERCAAFFALGRIKSTGKPVAVVTTSGTAAGELLPAAMEAHYSGLPLVLLTADRPKKMRGSGAPQTAEQVGLFSHYVSHTLDLEAVEDWIPFSDLKRPIHINACFNEPLLEAEDGQSPYRMDLSLSPDADRAQLPIHRFSFPLEVRNQVQDFIGRVKHPLAIVGMLPASAREAVIEFLLCWEIPTYCEGLSGLREDRRLDKIRVSGNDSVFERAARGDYPIDGIVRIGGVPTLRLWRDLELKYSDLPVLSLSSLPFSGLGRPSEMIQGPLDQVCDELRKHFGARALNGLNASGAPGAVDASRFLELDRQRKEGLEVLLRSEPCSEPGLLAALSRRISSGSRVYLGNSLPVREWDLAATSENRGLQLWGSRGLSGIDGQVSTFLGYASSAQENWAILGDLTALYDLPGPWILSQLRDTQVNLVVVNNGGGKIFSRMFQQPEFQNQHELRFRAWAELWNLKYVTWNQVPEVIDRTQDHQIIEILPSEEATQRFWKKYLEL